MNKGDIAFAWYRPLFSNSLAINAIVVSFSVLVLSWLLGRLHSAFPRIFLIVHLPGHNDDDDDLGP
jgi:hypothetical protein